MYNLNTGKGKERKMTHLIRVSVPQSYWTDAIAERELHLTGVDPAHAKIARELLAQGFMVEDDPANWETNKPTRKGRLVIDLSVEDITELIEHCSLYSQGHYDADLEKPYKYFGSKLKEKLATVVS